MNEILIVSIVIVILIVALSFLLYYIMKRTSLLMKNNFLNKVEKLDVLINDKEKKVEELNMNIIEKQKELEDEMRIKKEDSLEMLKTNEVLLPKYADFEDKNLLSNYKVIKEKFNFDATEVIQKFISKIDDYSDEKYQMLIKIRNYFSYDVIYRISSYKSFEQKIILVGILQENEKKILSDILKKEKFDIKSFIHELDEMIRKNDPSIIIIVGNKNISYNSINENIKTIYDEKITEGFKIVYKGVIYDYSI